LELEELRAKGRNGDLADSDLEGGLPPSSDEEVDESGEDDEEDGANQKQGDGEEEDEDEDEEDVDGRNKEA